MYFFPLFLSLSGLCLNLWKQPEMYFRFSVSEKWPLIILHYWSLNIIFFTSFFLLNMYIQNNFTGMKVCIKIMTSFTNCDQHYVRCKVQIHFSVYVFHNSYHAFLKDTMHNNSAWESILLKQTQKTCFMEIFTTLFRK